MLFVLLALCAVAIAVQSGLLARLLGAAKRTPVPTTAPIASVTRTRTPPVATYTLAATDTRQPTRTHTAVATQRPTSTSTPRPTSTATPTLVTKVLDKAGITLVYVPAGEFLMGSADSDTQRASNEKPQHTVYLDGYWIGQTEVTNAQFHKFVAAGGYSTREYWTDEGWQWKESRGFTEPMAMYWADEQWNKKPDYPVVGVSWYEAAAYAKWAGVRLPTEAEWEYAARGGPLSRGYVYAGGYYFDAVAWYNDNSDGRTHAVCGKVANELGLYDMSGNVWEWCADWYGENYYPQSPRENPRGPLSGSDRVMRGGSWGSSRETARCAYRDRWSPGSRFIYLGFRVAE
jgi:formylglycine-generating enzyme required for sulfatase activity